MLSFKEAAKYLGKHPQTLESYQNSNILMPDIRYGKLKSRMYSIESLDEFKKNHLESNRPTMPEIAKLYGVTQQTVKYHFRTKRKVRPYGSRGGAMTFAWEDVSKVANDENWQEV